MAKQHHFSLPEPGVYHRFDNWLAGKPDAVLTFALLAMAVFLVFVALFQENRVLKAVVIAWAVLP